MIYQIKLTYLDDHEVELFVSKDEITEFFDNITAGRVFRNKEDGVGFWTSFGQVRHIFVYPQIEVKPKKENTVIESING